MKKRILVGGFAAVMALSASAQTRKAPPPPPPVPAEATEAPAPPDQSLPPLPPNEIDAFMKRNPSVKHIHWKDDELILRLKSGKEERYNLADEKSRKAAEAKYGELPEAPPPPPPPPPPPAPAAPPAPPKPPKTRMLE